MNFTREPIIETVITPREGCKLVIRNSKGSGQEEYLVDAVEVVSFGHSLFFRSAERAKAFLVPVSDYEVLESKEVRMSLKNAAPERSIKIGGGREGSARPAREEVQEMGSVEEPPVEHILDRTPERPLDRDRKRDKRRRGRRGGGRSDMQETRKTSSVEEALPMHGAEVPEGSSLEENKPHTFISKLFPPPPTLIKETLSRYKLAEVEGVEEDVFSASEERFNDLEDDRPIVESKPGTEEDIPFED